MARTIASTPNPLCMALAMETSIANFDCNALESVCVDVEISEVCLVAHLAR